jgi:transcriptional regulator with XRE-family HTH domain
MELPEKVRMVRIIKGLKQDTVARSRGIQQSTYNRMEKGTLRISEEKLAEIAEAIGVDEELIRDIDKHLVFIHNIETQNGGNPQYHVSYSISEKEQELYEARIKQLEEENRFLKKLIEERLK